MRHRYRNFAAAVAAIALTFSVSMIVLSAQNVPNTAPARIDGKPNFNGLWQALTGANWDIQDHSSEPGPYYQLGATFAIPAGQGIVEGNEIPYRPEALEQRKKNRPHEADHHVEFL